ncbi:MAG: STAS domain-containing protein [Verrucomicrobiota bacterium]
MKITTQKENDILVLHLDGRLDAGWCDPVQSAFDDAVKAGEHRMHFDMAKVVYLSSAGIRVLLTSHKQLAGIKGLFGIVNASSFVRNVLDLAGLEELLVESDEGVGMGSGEDVCAHQSASASFEILDDAKKAAAIILQKHGEPTALAQGRPDGQHEQVTFSANRFALGVGALGSNAEDIDSRMGELLSVAGCAAYQPTDGSNRPDYMICEGDLIPEGQFLLGLSGELPGALIRFEACAEKRNVGLSEVCQALLDLSGHEALAVVGITETSGLVGTSLRQSPAPAGTREDRFAFPAIRDWLSFSSERSHRDSISLLSGVVAKAGSSLDPFLRPLEAQSDLLGHLHAAAFHYRPLRKGRIDLHESVNDLFDGDHLQSVLHLLNDPRGITGAGESEFYRGALWIAPIAL